MMQIRKAKDRGHANYGWLDTYHTFSFADYMDPKFMGFRSLRVINEDTVEPGQGFGTHGHRDMEIITCVLEGELEHKDSMGNGAVIRPGDVQRMSAGTGVTHSEFNPSKTKPVHLLQIWILPEAAGLKPSYEQQTFKNEERKNRFRLVASGRPREGAVKIHQDAELYVSVLEKNNEIEYALDKNRHAWLQVARGLVTANGSVLEAGDGAVIEKDSVHVRADKDSEALLFDLS